MKTFAVIGIGRFGQAVAKKLFSMGYEVLAVDSSTELINDIEPYVTQAVACDAKDENVLNALGIRNYDCVVVGVTANLSDSILITMHLIEMGVKQVVCKARNINHKKILEKIGAHTVIIPEYEVGKKTALNLVSNHFLDLLSLSDKYGIVDMKVPKSWIGNTIFELDIRKKYSINVIAIKNINNDNEVLINPTPDYKFKSSDIVVVVGEMMIIQNIDNGD